MTSVPPEHDAGPPYATDASQRTSDALRRGDYSELSSALVLWLTAAAVVLSLGALALVAARI
jgi:hypothetical protein